MKVPAQFKYNGVIDLLCDAVFQCRLAAGTDDSYTMNRYARASILSSILALESAANALLLSLGFSKKFSEDLDKLPVLAKFDAYLRFSDEACPLNRNLAEVQRVQHLLSARNDYVHSKVKSIPTEVGPFKDQGDMVCLPLELTGKQWQSVGIPKEPMFWSADNARSALSATVAFLRMVICDCAKLSPDDVRYLLHSRIEIGETDVTMTFDEFVKELEDTSDLGMSFEFLGFPGPAAE